MPKQTRVGITAPGMTREHPTGVGNHLSELLRNLDPPPGDPEIHVLGTLPDSLDVNSELHLHPVPSDRVSRRLFEDHLGFGLRARNLDLDLLHAPKSVVPLGFPGRLTMTVHDVIFLTHPQFYTRRERWYWSLVLRWSVRRADALVAVSRHTAHQLSTHLGLDPDDIQVIPNGVNTDRFHPRPSDSPLNSPTFLDRIDSYYLYLGTFTPRKNVKRLIEGYAWARNSYADLPDLVLAGPPESGAEPLQQHLRELNLCSAVHFPGYIQDHHLPELYRQADRLVYPSLAEGFGLPVLQALFCGCPVACSDREVLREVGGDLPTYFDPLDPASIGEALNPDILPSRVDPDRRDDLATQYNSSRIARLYLDFFNQELELCTL